jgi:hypothetical protein
MSNLAGQIRRNAAIFRPGFSQQQQQHSPNMQQVIGSTYCQSF